MIEGRGLTKRFGGVTALNAVDIKVEQGGSPPCSGRWRRQVDAGRLPLRRPAAWTRAMIVIGRRGRRSSARPTMRAAAGIAVIHQEPQMLEEQSVAANIYLPRLGAGLDRCGAGTRALEAMARKHLAALDIRDLDPKAKMRGIKSAHRQLRSQSRALINAAQSAVSRRAQCEPRRSKNPSGCSRWCAACATAVWPWCWSATGCAKSTAICDHIVVMRDGVKSGRCAGRRSCRSSAPCAFDYRRRQADRRDANCRRCNANDNTAVPLIEVDWALSRSRLQRHQLQHPAGEILGMSGLVGSAVPRSPSPSIGAAQAICGHAVTYRQTGPCSSAIPAKPCSAGIAFVPRRAAAMPYSTASRSISTSAPAPGANAAAACIAAVLPKHQRGAPPHGAAQGESAARLLTPALLPSQAATARKAAVRPRAVHQSASAIILDEPTHGVERSCTKRENPRPHARARRRGPRRAGSSPARSRKSSNSQPASSSSIEGRIAGELPQAAHPSKDVLARNFGEQGVING